MIHIRPMTSADVELGMRLKQQAGWNQTAADWQRFLQLEPTGCFVAECDGLAAGTTTTCAFDGVGWIAMVLVDRAYRHQGLGTRLVMHAVEYLTQQGVRTVRLDATALGRPVYERLGFVAEYELARFEGRSQCPHPAESCIVPVTSGDLAGLAELDRRASGGDRGRLLARLLAEEPAGAGRAVLDGTLEGYVMTRSGSRATQIGPAVATTPRAGLALLNWALARSNGQPVFVDVARDNSAAVEWAQSQSLAEQRGFTRMRLGPAPGGQRGLLWASSGPEKG